MLTVQHTFNKMAIGFFNKKLYQYLAEVLIMFFRQLLEGKLKLLVSHPFQFVCFINFWGHNVLS